MLKNHTKLAIPHQSLYKTTIIFSCSKLGFPLEYKTKQKTRLTIQEIKHYESCINHTLPTPNPIQNATNPLAEASDQAM